MILYLVHARSTHTEKELEFPAETKRFLHVSAAHSAAFGARHTHTSRHNKTHLHRRRVQRTHTFGDHSVFLAVRASERAAGWERRLWSRSAASPGLAGGCWYWFQRLQWLALAHRWSIQHLARCTKAPLHVGNQILFLSICWRVWVTQNLYRMGEREESAQIKRWFSPFRSLASRLFVFALSLAAPEPISHRRPWGFALCLAAH